MREFTIGGVIRRTFALISRHFGAFAVATAVLVFLPSLVSSASGVTTTRAFDAAGHLRDTSTNVSLLGGGGSVLVWLTSLLLYGIVVRAALGDLRGEPFDISAGLAASLKAFLPNLGIWILYYIAIVVGFVLLVVPGLMLQCTWLVVIPSSMAEGTGVVGAFRRSRSLTSGHRWTIFGLLLLYALLFVLVGVLAFFGASTLSNGGGASFWALKIANAALSAVISLVGSAGVAACYIELRGIEGDPMSRDLVEAFA